MLKGVWALPVLACLAGCITVRGVDASEEDRNPEGRYVSGNPDDVRIITSDIDNFWRAYDESTPEDGLRIYRDEYLARGTVGLKEFMRLKIGNVANLVSNIWKHWHYYASVRSSTLAIRSQEGRIRESFRKLKELYPDAVFPNVYFLIGAMHSGGISFDKGIAIGAELFCETPSSPLDELNQWERSVVQPVAKIPAVVAHELAHYEQDFEKDPESLLDRSIAEGEADFLSELIAGTQINELQHRYGDQHEEEVWNEFRAEMHGTDYSRWLYNGGALAADGAPITRPADLGYYVGYKICQSYYDKAEDKKRAVKEMLGIKDFERFLRDSGYGLRFATRAPKASQSGTNARDKSFDTIGGVTLIGETTSTLTVVRAPAH